MTDAADHDVASRSPVAGSRPWLHALAVYAILALEGWVTVVVLYAVPIMDLAWSPFFQLGQTVLMAGTLGLLGWAFNRTGYRWVWSGAIGLVIGLIGPKLVLIAGLSAPWLVGLAPALATLILYRGRARVTGIVTLSIVVTGYVAFVVLILIALANWHFVF
ncbi:hypothetical protein [Diaminobutyricibacter sp. McL0608]|uniref:hypothetical protein n=1 Tax=Leifsonia sp. McL0608 TaxID=3143537 RepID=UPI0031F2E698